MDMKPMDSVMKASTPIRMPDRIEVKEDGTVQAQVQTPTDKVEIKKKRKTKDGFLANTAKTILSGVGLGSGLVGGGIIGAGLGATGSVISGLAGSSLSWASLGTGGMIGGIAGAVIFGAAGTYGGWTFATALIKGGRFLNKLLFTKEPLSEEQQVALDKIKQVEDNPKDATKALNYINNNLSADENLDKETDLYVNLLNHFSNKKTDSALSAYATLKKELPPGAERDTAAAELGKFKEVFNDPEGAMDALYIVLQNLNAKDSLAAESQNLVSVAESMKKCTPEHAVISPEVAGGAYQVFKKKFSPDERAGAVTATLGQFESAQFEPKVVLANLQTVVDGLQKGDDLASESKNLMSLIGQFNSPETARTAYTTVKTNFPPGSRGEALKHFASLAEKETPEKAGEVLVGVYKGLYQGETLGDQLKFYTDLRKMMESSKDAGGSALDAYKTICSSFEPGKDRTAAVKQFTKLVAAETAAGQDAGNASADFKFLYTHMSEGEKLSEQMDAFIGLLKSQGSSSKAQQAYVDAKFQELYGK